MNPVALTRAALTLALAASLLAAPASAQPQAPKRVVQTPSAQVKGEALFNQSCVFCHGGERTPGEVMLRRRMGAEQARLQTRTDMDADYVRAVVRRGIGGMPNYRKTELSDDDLDAVIAYLIRNNGKAAANAP